MSLEKLSKHDYVSQMRLSINTSYTISLFSFVFAAQFGGINPSLYLNPEPEEKEVIFSSYGLIIMPEAYSLQ